MIHYSNQQKRQALKLSRKVEAMRTVLDRLDYPTILELCRRADAEVGQDVYHSRLSVGSRGQHGASVVEEAVFDAHGLRRPLADPVGDHVQEIVQRINEGVVITKRIQFLVYTLTRGISAPKGGGREDHLQGVCTIECCQEAPSGIGNDRLRAGYCPVHYSRWRTFRRAHSFSDPGSARLAFALEENAADDSYSPM